VIARCIYSSPLLLLLDEFTSAVDASISNRALSYLLSQPCTVIWVTQSFPVSTMWSLDWIIVMHEGRIVEQGNHQHLMNLDGRYRRMFEAFSGACVDGSLMVGDCD
jgi:ABC-type multidrug transport system fused ATPase/permease subunit